MKGKNGKYKLNPDYSFVGKINLSMPNMLVTTVKGKKPTYKGDVCELSRKAKAQIVEYFYDDKDDDDDSDPYVEILFEKVLVLLEKTEMPERDVNFQLEKIVDEVHNKNMTVISKKMSYKYLQSLYAEFRKENNSDYIEPF